MSDDHQILEELREVRTVLLNVVERLATLESQGKTILGNGQPGILTLHSQAIQELQRWRWRVTGISLGVSAVVSGAVALLVKLLS